MSLADLFDVSDRLGEEVPENKVRVTEEIGRAHV